MVFVPVSPIVGPIKRNAKSAFRENFSNRRRATELYVKIVSRLSLATLDFNSDANPIKTIRAQRLSYGLASQQAPSATAQISGRASYPRHGDRPYSLRA